VVSLFEGAPGGEIFRTSAVFSARTAIGPMAATFELPGYTFMKTL
jgi:hypothetical protein